MRNEQFERGGKRDKRNGDVDENNSAEQLGPCEHHLILLLFFTIHLEAVGT